MTENVPTIAGTEPGITITPDGETPPDPHGAADERLADPITHDPVDAAPTGTDETDTPHVGEAGLVPPGGDDAAATATPSVEGLSQP